MPFPSFRRVRPASRNCGFLAAVLALVGQLAFGSLAPDDVAGRQSAALDAISVLCIDHASDQGSERPHRHHAVDLALCSLGIDLALPGFILTPATLPVPSRSFTAAYRMRERPPDRGPPPATARVSAP